MAQTWPIKVTPESIIGHFEKGHRTINAGRPPQTFLPLMPANVIKNYYI
jgi:hypothetical protein